MDRSRRILLIGPAGQVGTALSRRLPTLGDCVFASRESAVLPLDLSDLESISGLLADTQPDIVVNAAAYTQVDRAEDERDMAWKVNAEAVDRLARECSQRGAMFIHYSTDYVFSGEPGRPWSETDDVAPLSTYGRSKYAGEQAVLGAGGNALVFRTSWVFSETGHNFVKTMLRLFGERDELNVVDDQIGTPTSADAIADATLAVLERKIAHSHEQHGKRGLYHLSCSGETSWYGFACAIRDRVGADVKINPIPTSAYPLPAPRPAYSVLDNTRLNEDFGVRLPAWEKALDDCLHALGVV